MEAFAYIDDVSIGLSRITADMVSAFDFRRRELDDIGKDDSTTTQRVGPDGR